MKILFVASDNDPYSGAFRSMAKLISLLQQKYGHDIIVVLPHKGAGEQMLDNAGIRNVLIPSYRWTVQFGDKKKPIEWVKHIFKRGITRIASYRIARLIRHENIDLVHINTSCGYVGALSALLCKIPFVWHIREFLEEDQGRQIWDKEKGYALMREATKVVAISKSIYEKYLPIIGEEKLVNILNGIDPADYYLPDHELFKSQDIHFLMIGAINEEKGQRIAIEACLKLLKEGIHNFKLRIVGRGREDYIMSLKEMVLEEGAEKYIEFCGPSSDTTQYYSTSDILLMCSRAEAFGRVTVEAMFAGDLVIGADNAGTEELIQDGETGLLYESENAQSLANRITFAMQHTEKMNMIAKKGQDYMLKNMTAEKNAENINALYNEIVS